MFRHSVVFQRVFYRGAAEPWVILWTAETAAALMLPEWLCFGNSPCEREMQHDRVQRRTGASATESFCLTLALVIYCPLFPAPSFSQGQRRREHPARFGESLCDESFNLCWIYPDASISGSLMWVSGLLRARSLDLLIWKWFIQN